MVASLIAAAVWWPGSLIVQRGITALIMPVGLVWLGSIALLIWAWRRRERRVAGGLAVVLVVLTLGGNRGLSKFALDRLEGEYQRVDALEAGNCDVVFVLGGGAGRGPEGQLNVSSSGDRIVLAARLYHAGKTKRLVCSGKVAAPYWPEDRDPGRMSYLLLHDLAVPREALALLGGRNTKEEMGEIKSFVGTNAVTRAGVVTSAWHMRRAIRLAKNEGLALTPLPADFHGGEVNWRDYSLIPEGGALAEMGLAMKELIAGVIGR